MSDSNSNEGEETPGNPKRDSNPPQVKINEVVEIEQLDSLISHSMIDWVRNVIAVAVWIGLIFAVNAGMKR